MGNTREELIKRKDDLYTVQKESQDAYDKALFTSSSGALAISFAFVKDFLGEDSIVNINFLFWAWVLWGLTIVTVMYSHYSSVIAHKDAINETDSEIAALNNHGGNKEANSKKPDDKVPKHFGGIFDKLTTWLNNLGGIFFLLGIVLVSYFVKINLEVKYMEKQKLDQQRQVIINEGKNVKTPTPGAPQPTKGQNVKPKSPNNK